MQQFVVPQFIDVETRILGPITLRQFIIMLAAGLFLFISYKLSDFTLFVVEGVLIFFIFGIIAFFKVNGQPFHYFILNFTQTMIRPKLKIWRNGAEKSKVAKKKSQIDEIKIYSNRKSFITKSRLSELTLIIDTGGVYQGENNE